MKDEIKKIILFNDDFDNYNQEKGIDVLVYLTDDQQFLATFYSYDLIQKKITTFKQYMWKQNAIFSKNYELETLNWIINDMLESGEFYLAFEKLS